MLVSQTFVCQLDNATRFLQTSLVRDEEIYELLGRQIAARRRQLKMTQSKLAAKVGMSRASIANIEGGRQSVLVHHLYRFAEALAMSDASELLPATVMPSRVRFEMIGVPLSDDSISEQSKVQISDMVSKAVLAQRTKAKS